MKKVLPFFILLSALSVSGSAAFYSVYGLGKLFAGASLQVMIMAGSLEVAKLVMATALHRYWAIMNRLMRAYLTVAVVLLIGITSAGIYGFLSNAYQITASKDAIVTKEISILEMKRERFAEQRSEYQIEKDQVVKSISELRTALSNPNSVQYVDQRTKQVVTTTSTANRKAFERQLGDGVSRRDEISRKIEALTDSLTAIDVRVVEAQANSDVAAELGPLKYLSGLTGYPMDRIVNWFLIMLIFVFDPLAVVLVVLANFSFEQGYGGSFWRSVKKSAAESTVNDTGDQTVDVDDNTSPIIVRESSEPVIVTSTEPSMVVDNDLPDHVKEAMRGVDTLGKLSPAQRRNMTHEEIEEWYRNNML